MSRDRQGLGPRLFVAVAVVCILIGALLSKCEFPDWQECTSKESIQTCIPKVKE